MPPDEGVVGMKLPSTGVQIAMEPSLAAMKVPCMRPMNPACFWLKAALSPPPTPLLAVGSLLNSQTSKVAAAVAGPVSGDSSTTWVSNRGALLASDARKLIGVTDAAAALLLTPSPVA